MAKPKTDVIEVEFKDKFQSLMDDAINLKITPEAKVVLTTMLWMRKSEMTLQELCNVCNAPLGDIQDGSHALRAAKINVAKGYDKVTLAKEWQL